MGRAEPAVLPAVGQGQLVPNNWRLGAVSADGGGGGSADEGQDQGERGDRDRGRLADERAQAAHGVSPLVERRAGGCGATVPQTGTPEDRCIEQRLLIRPGRAQVERPFSSVVEVENECRDVPGVVFAPVVATFQRQSGDPQRLRHSWALRQLVGAGEGHLRVDVTVTERVGGPGRLALPGKLMAVVVAPARPGADPGLVLGREQLACLGEPDPGVYLWLRQPGQLRAERAHRRPHRPH